MSNEVNLGQAGFVPQFGQMFRASGKHSCLVQVVALTQNTKCSKAMCHQECSEEPTDHQGLGMTWFFPTMFTLVEPVLFLITNTQHQKTFLQFTNILLKESSIFSCSYPERLPGYFLNLVEIQLWTSTYKVSELCCKWWYDFALIIGTELWHGLG